MYISPLFRISIHAPRTGSDVGGCGRGKWLTYFNPRSPHGERHPTIDVQGGAWVFQSTLPARGATVSRQPRGNSFVISIHAPRTGSDSRWKQSSPHNRNISIHAPRTGSDIATERLKDFLQKFQSTLPARGATKWTALKGLITEFQSTLPARGATTSC